MIQPRTASYNELIEALKFYTVKIGQTVDEINRLHGPESQQCQMQNGRSLADWLNYTNMQNLMNNPNDFNQFKIREV